MLTGFSETEIIKDRFLVIQVERMFLNRNIDARNKSVDCITILKSKQKWGPSLSNATRQLLFLVPKFSY